MYFNYTPHGYCVEEAFRSFTPLYLATAELIADKSERRQYLIDNFLNQFEDFEQFVRNDISDLVASVEGFYQDNFIFLRWVHAVAKKYEYTLMYEYRKAIHMTTDRELIRAQLFKKFSYHW